jgi:[ribosomal protein S5]-alanine N-acetyltransferase
MAGCSDVTATRPLDLDDAPALAALLAADRDVLAPWQPLRPDRYFTEAGQREAVAEALQQQASGLAVPLVVQDDHGAVVGTMTLQSIIRGAFQSCSVGYWLAESAQGRGLATAALREAVSRAFSDLRLHRVQAETLTHNRRSQRVLERVGFVQYGRADAYLHIAGRWQANLLLQLITPTPERVDVGQERDWV